MRLSLLLNLAAKHITDLKRLFDLDKYSTFVKTPIAFLRFQFTVRLAISLFHTILYYGFFPD